MKRNPKVGSPAWFRDNFGTEEKFLRAVFLARLAKDINPNCPKCGADRSHYRYLIGRRSFQCSKCAFQLSPLAGTVFKNLRIELTAFGDILYEIISSRHLVSSNSLREKYKIDKKTSWRTNKRVHNLMADAQAGIKLTGEVQIDEAGHDTGNQGMSRHYKWKRGRSREKSETMFAMVEKPRFDENGKRIPTRAIIYVIPDQTGKTILSNITENLVPSDDLLLVTDDYDAYNELEKIGFKHEVVNHKKWRYKNPKGYTTNVVEGYWSQLRRSTKRLIRVSAAELQRYLLARNFQYNNRHLENHERLEVLLASLPPMMAPLHEKFSIQRQFNKAA